MLHLCKHSLIGEGKNKLVCSFVKGLLPLLFGTVGNRISEFDDIHRRKSVL